MSTRDNSPASKTNLLTPLLALIVLCLAGAAVLTLLTRGAKPAAALAT